MNEQGSPRGTRVNISPDMLRISKTLTCDCGGMLFHSGVVIKKISALVSQSGEEEAYPLEVLVCDNCGKVPNEIDSLKLLPEEVLAKKSNLTIKK